MKTKRIKISVRGRLEQKLDKDVGALAKKIVDLTFKGKVRRVDQRDLLLFDTFNGLTMEVLFEWSDRWCAERDKQGKKAAKK